MTKRIYTLLVLLFCVTFTFAQSSLDVPSYNGTTDFQDEKKAMDGDNYFSPKPKNGTEIGINLGHEFIHGDVYARPGWGVGLHVRRSMNYVVSWRIQATLGQARGLDDRMSTFGGSGIQVENTLLPTLVYLFGGPSLMYFNGQSNILDANDGVYRDGDGNPGMQAYNAGTENTRQFFDWSKFKHIKNEILDDSYETEFFYRNGARDGNAPNGRVDYNIVGTNKYILLPGLDVGAGISRKITDKMNISLEHQAYLSLNDNLDGHNIGGSIDVPHYTNFKFNYIIGSKGTPLYWANPQDEQMKRVAQLERDKVELIDSDGDGVLDNFDDENDTPEGCAVDTRGRRLDSDGDGVFDCDDKEPYTSYAKTSKVDSDGVAPADEKPVPGLTREQILSLAKQENWGASTTVVQQTTAGRSGCGEWFLPMIHFDLNKYSLKSEAKAQLHQIAQVMKQCPEICIVAVGHTDKLNSDNYNQALSYNRARAAVDYLVQNYGISPSRLKVNYGGEATPLVDTSGSSYINRRVEFKVCNGEVDMGAPSGAAGSSSSSGFGTSGSAPVKY